jgi:pimeloyl-ACP methyl ester carboxylesterase
MELKQITYKNSTLSYRVGGEGNAVVLLHGFGEDGEVWRNQLDLFPHHRLIIPDLPGSGKSEFIDNISMESLARSVVAILDAEDIGQCTLIGHSMGGYIALAFADHHRERLKGFGLFHSTAYSDSEEKKETRRKGIQFIQRYGGAEFLKTTIPNLYGPASKNERKEIIEQHLLSVRNFSGEALVSYYEAMIARPDRSHLLSMTELPVLFIVGRHDAAVPFEDAMRQSHLPRISYIHILEDSGHMGMLEEPAESNKALLSYIELCERPIGEQTKEL